MGLNFRKSIKMGPVRINLSKSGIGYSVGTKGARITKSAKGKTRATVGIPGTGLSYSQSIGSKKKTSASKSKAISNARKSKSVSSVNGAQTNSFDSAEPFKKSIPLAILSAVIVFFIIGGITFIGLLIVLMILSLFGVINSSGAWFDFVLFGVPVTLGILSAVIAFRGSMPEKPENAEAVPDLESHPEAEKEVAPPPKDPGIEQFENAMQAIPRVEIPVSEPAPKHLLKDLPDYSFSNITRTTRMDSIFPLVFLDVETTGLYPSRSEIVEVSAIKFDFGMVPVSCFTTLCKPSKPIPEEASAVNHITDEMVTDAPSFREIAPALTEYLQGCNVAGHNLDFDLRFIFAHGAELPTEKRFYDTLELAHFTISEGYILNYKLDTLCGYYGIKREDAHRSLSDCYATSKIFSRLVFDKTSRQLDTCEESLLS